MDGLDISDMLQKRLAFNEVLSKKVRRAAETGKPFDPRDNAAKKDEQCTKRRQCEAHAAIEKVNNRPKHQSHLKSK